MELKIDPPAAVADRLRAVGIDLADLVLCTPTDINRLGEYCRQWLVATRRGVGVYEEDGRGESAIQLGLDEVEEFRTVAAIGSGLLQARVAGVYLDLLRYSNRRAYQFERVARRLDQLREHEAVVLGPEDGSDPRRCPKCQLTLQFAGDTCPRCVSRGAVFWRMLNLMRPYRRAATIMMTLMVVGICLDLVTPQLTRYLVDRVLPGSPEAAQAFQRDAVLRSQHVRMLLEVVAVLALVQIGRMLVNIFNGRLGSKVGTSITFDMRGRLVGHLQQLGLGFYDRQQVGSLVGRVAYDTEALHGFVQQMAGGFLFQLVLVVGVGVMMFTLNAKLALFTLIPAPFVILGTVIFWRFIYPKYHRVWDSSNKQAGMLSGILSGIRVVKAFGQERREYERFRSSSARLQQARRNVDMSVVTFNPMMSLVFQCGGWIVWFVGGRDVLGNEMTLGELMAFLGYLWMFYGPLTTLTLFTNWLTQFVTQAHRIFEILDTPAAIMEPAAPKPLRPMRGQIRFHRVTFGYSRHTPVLTKVSFEIPAGQLLGLVGRSGSGKTTLVNLISRFYDPDEGIVSIDGVDLREASIDDLRSQVGVVLQEPFLFRGSIWSNLTYGDPDATPERIIAAAKGAAAHDFIVRTPHGYDTWVGERGSGLSGGERQRVSIARVLLCDARIVILDEATSSVDSESEMQIQAALREVAKGRTTLAIAHRLSTLRHADRIMVVDDGKIVEDGTHDELVAKSGLYAKLVRIQGEVAPPPTVDLLSEQAKSETTCEARWDSPLPRPESHHPRWLTPDIARIHLGNRGALHLTVMNERIYGGVFALRCLPVHHPEEYVSLRYVHPDRGEIEVGLLRNINDWPEESQRLLREALLRRYFVHTIQGIDAIQLANNYLTFDVETDLGDVQFVMQWRTDRAQDYGVRGKMLLDVDENRYLIRDVQALTERERRLFERYIYW